ncbi:AMP-binding protein [Lactobacillus corticis]|uniref:Non-ribosomal peptide synthetase n=1 Tax=Lactobacillus corticis TaxID=2201249 RepID=A0A916QJI4_9LACO|nr:AMP-binding protein [Lactobacillus corticis]GFZ27758.1 hypothetical protein LCB40_16380 [Lactobacillus corticis]
MLVLDKFEETLAVYPNKIAVQAQTGSFTFVQVENLANHLALQLDRQGAQEIVPYYLQDTCYVLSTVLGIWKSGRTPMPLVSALPLAGALDRVKEVSFSNLVTDFAADAAVRIDQLNSEIATSYQTKQSAKYAYILSTSGSTGVPKKVFLTPANIEWILSVVYPLIGVDQNTSFLFSTPYSFDVSLTEILAPAVAGAKLVCLPASPSKSESIRMIPAMLRNKQITHLSLSPSFAEVLVQIAGEAVFDNLTHLMVAGEAFPASLAQKLQHAIASGCNVYNLYGPTETTVYAFCHEVSGNEEKYVPIGRPLPGVNYLLPKNNNKGELYISGKGVTAGYVLDPVKDRASFKIIAGQRYYATGDNVMRADNGELIFLERQDDQVQVNGIRVELGEVEAVGGKVPGVQAAVCKYYHGRIYVFYLSKTDKAKEIKQALPKYLNPIVVHATEFLYNYNRKFDTKQMIDKFYTRKNASKGTETIEKLQYLLSKYQVQKIEDLDSLEFVRFLIDVEEEFELEISDSQVAGLKTLGQLAAYLQQDQLKQQMTGQVEQAEIINLQYQLQKLDHSCFPERITASSSQQSLFRQRKKSFTQLKIALKQVDGVTIYKLHRLLKELSKKVDLLQFAWFSEGDNLYFKRLKQADPIIYATERSFSEVELGQILYRKSGDPIYLGLVNPAKQELELVFSHHTLDASSAGKLEQIIAQLYRKELSIADVPTSSYQNFMAWVDQVNQQTDLRTALNYLPKAQGNLALKRDESRLHVIKFAANTGTTDEVYQLSLFLLSQAIMIDQGWEQVTGEIALNLRDFAGFSAESVIGDIHATVPFEVRKNDTLDDFSTRYQNWVDFYKSGVDYRYCLFNHQGKNLDFLAQVAKRWNHKNISPNYIGEVKSIAALLQEINAMPFKANYITLASHAGTIYAILYGDLLQKDQYQLQVGDHQYKLVNEAIRRSRIG